MAEEHLQLLPYIINGHDSGVIVLNEELKTVLINDWVNKHAKFKHSELLNQDIDFLFPKIKTQRIFSVILEAIILNRASLLSQAIHQSPLPLYQNSKINGKQLPMQQRITIKPLKINNKKYCLIQIFDVSSAVAKEYLLRATATKAQIARLEAESYSKIKSEFVSTISHEIRTPLTSISGSVSLILGGATGELNPKTTEMLQIVQRNSDRLLNLINELLDIQKIESGMVNFDFEEKPLQPLISSCIEMNNAYAEKFKIKYNFIENKHNYKVFIDEKRISQVILNLLSNATKFSDKNSTITIKIEKNNSNVRTIVTDNGPGISDEFKTKIFTKFSQEQTADNRLHAGTGLGLCISKSIILNHNGNINFYNNKKGATFYFDLPLDKPDYPSNSSA